MFKKQVYLRCFKLFNLNYLFLFDYICTILTSANRLLHKLTLKKKLHQYETNFFFLGKEP